MASLQQWIRAAAIVAAICGSVTPVNAQTSLATLRGRVIDEQGGVLPGATVTARQAETNFTRTGVTNENGQFYLPSLPAGSYEVTVELSGFGTDKRTVVLRVGQEIDRRLHAEGGQASQETVEVTGRAVPRRDPGDARRTWWTSRADRQPADHRPELRRPREARARRDLERRRRDGLLDGGPAPVPEQGVRGRRHQRAAVLRHAGRVVPAGLGPGIPGDDQRLLRGVRPGVGRRAERHHAERVEHVRRPRLRLLPQRQVGHAAVRRPVQEGRRAASTTSTSRSS